MNCIDCGIKISKKAERCHSCDSKLKWSNLELRKQVSNRLSRCIIKECPICKISFKKKRKKQLYCSKECALKSDKHYIFTKEDCKKSIKNQSKRSKNEVYFANLCENEFTEVLLNEPIFNGWDADIILLNYKIAILWNGNWHYKKITKKHSLLQVQNRDKIKTKEIINKDYFPYIIKDEGKYNKRFVENEFNKLKLLIQTRK
jgi:hypothetical protein